MKFNEHSLEMAIIDLLTDEGYVHVNGKDLQRNKSEVLLIDDLKKYLSERYSAVNLTDTEIERIILQIRSASGNLYESNKSFMKLLMDGFIFNRENRELKDIYISLIDYENPEKNIFKVVNQLEIKGYEQVRIPDTIIYVNGLPLIVFEFKSAINENTTIHDAYIQLTVRYKRDIPELFIYNAFAVISNGVNNKYGSIFSDYDFFYSWRKINSDDKNVDGIDSLFTTIKGLFQRQRLLEVIKNFIYFPDQSNKEAKIICRYPQFFAATKLFENIKLHMRPTGDGKGGTYFGTTGCGKSYAMIFLARMLMKSKYFKNPTIIVITDRTDLDDQLSEQFVESKLFIGDQEIINIDSREHLKRKLNGITSGGIFLTTIQKFSEDISLLSERSNIICISDEAHRSQINLEQKVSVINDSVVKKYGFAKYLHDSLPNATYVGFTGTPIDATIKVFGDIVERYTMSESVKDGITVNLVYEGRAAKVVLDNAKVNEIEEYYARCAVEGANEYQIEESKKAVTHLEAILGDEDRLRSVADDFIKHYETRVAEGSTVAGKTIFVCANRRIAYKFYKLLIEQRPAWAEEKITSADDKETKPIAMVNLVMTRDKDDELEMYNLLGSKEDRKELDRQFKNIKSNFKIAIVVDMWLTGFDVPFLDTMYIDKPIQRHTLIQTISRVNRIYKGKTKGLIVDYIGIKNNLDIAINEYTNFNVEEIEGIKQSVKIVKDQLDVLNKMFHKFNDSDYFNGTPKEQLKCLNRAVEYVQLTKNLESRFMRAVKRLKEAFNLCVSNDEISDDEKDRIHFYLAIRSILFKLTKGDVPDISQMNKRVQQMIEDAIQADGIEELFETNKPVDVDILSDEYLSKIAQMKLPNTKIKILQRLLSQAIEEFRRVNKIKGVEFAKRLKNIVDNYNERNDDIVFANEVLDDVADQLMNLLQQLKNEKQSFKDMGIDFEEKAFFDILAAVAEKFKFEYPEDKMIALSKRIKLIVEDKAKYADWSLRDDIKANLQVDLILALDEYGYPPVTIDDVYKDVLEQAENFRKYQN